MSKQRHGEYAATPAYPPFVAREVVTLCAVDPDLFTTFGDRGKARRTRVATAKALCGPCPLKAECAQWATDTMQTGVWGGTDEFDRAMIRRRGNTDEARKEAYRLAYA